MNTEPNQPLQFDKADFAGQPTLTCAFCKAPITSEYFQVNGQVVCPKCRDGIGSFVASGAEGARLALAAGAGIGAGVGGFIIYYLVLKMTGINFGLVAILVGWMVGTAVRWGSGRLGGLSYQILAAILTYIAICGTYIPLLIRSGRDWATAFVVSMAAPWIQGVDIIGWIILGFGVLYAWQINHKVNLEVSGPFFTRQAPPPAAS
jgi:hypothetical protein